MKRIIDFILSPFEKDLGYFLCLWIFASVPIVSFHLCNGSWLVSIIYGLKGYFVCFLICLATRIFPGYIKKYFEILMIVLGIINFALDFSVLELTQSSFSEDTVAIILGTNVSESKEFVGMYLTPMLILLTILCTILAITLYIIGRKGFLRIHNRILVYSLFLIFVASLFSIRFNYNNYKLGNIFINKLILFAKYDKPEVLSEFRLNPSVSIDGEKPKNIVVIIGESHSRFHSSLYGYEKITNPMLSLLLESDSLLVFNNVSSADLSTIPAFKKMMSIYSSKNEDKNWAECLTVYDVLRQSSYNTIWVSNQSSSGIYDNVVSSYADLADTVVWCGTRGMGMSKHDKDAIVIDDIKKLRERTNDSNNVWFIHLMGSHPKFELRYPIDYDVFDAEDYLANEPSQREILATYDNSLLYNDYVVSEIMKCYSRDDAIVLYLSDHALDIYVSDPEYAGHARRTDPISVKEGSAVPFWVYGSHDYRMNHLDEWEKIGTASQSNKPYNLENLMFTIMDLCNISLSDSTEMGPSIFDLE